MGQPRLSERVLALGPGRLYVGVVSPGSRFPRLAAILAVLALALTPAAVAAAHQPKVKAPKSGSEYDGNHKLVIYISGKSIELVAFNFRFLWTAWRADSSSAAGPSAASSTW